MKSNESVSESTGAHVGPIRVAGRENKYVYYKKGKVKSKNKSYKQALHETNPAQPRYVY